LGQFITGPDDDSKMS